MKLKKLLPKAKESRKVEEYKVPQKLKYFTNVAGRTPVDYVLPDEVSNIIKTLPAICKDFMKTGVDEFNAAYVDTYIHNRLELAKDDLKEQREHHKYVIQQIQSADAVYKIKYLNEKEQIESTINKFSEGGEADA